jgi:hypothetical protein
MCILKRVRFFAACESAFRQKGLRHYRGCSMKFVQYVYTTKLSRRVNTFPFLSPFSLPTQGCVKNPLLLRHPPIPL